MSVTDSREFDLSHPSHPVLWLGLKPAISQWDSGNIVSFSVFTGSHVCDVSGHTVELQSNYQS